MEQNLSGEPSAESIVLSSVRIVLVAPAGPLNVGSAARVMKNFGLSQLVLVTPQCDPLGPEAMQMAVHAKDVLHAAKVVSTIPEALDGCTRAIATTARTRGFNAPLQLPEIVLPSLLPSDISKAPTPHAPRPTPHAALIFGPEDRGLSNEELIYAQQFTKIPTHPGYSALNLAQAVAVCCYELYRASLSASFTHQLDSLNPNALAHPSPSSDDQDHKNTLRTAPLSAKQTESIHSTAAPSAQRAGWDAAGPNQATTNQATNGAQLNELEGYYQHLETVLRKVEYLMPHTAASRMRKFRQLLHRANPTSNEIALLRGILRQTEWALSESHKDER
ncbi:MAG: RNA methyltransferase [Cyanobacteria bacterium J06598_3]